MNQKNKKNLKDQKIVEREITEEMRDSYMEYAMSVIISRALPDVRDGLKPVQRRTLYSMFEMGVRADGKFRKSATVVGHTMGAYHPHGDAPIYEALMRMAQNFTLRYPLVQGQGNIGSIDDPSEYAAQRYTEVKLSRIGELMLKDIEKNTVDFVDNYDGTKKEPVVLPSPIPNILLNGSLGIAVGMATNIPPHNLKEVIDVLILILDKKISNPQQIFEVFKGPDFPTGGEIFNFNEIKNAYLRGKGPILMRAKAKIEKGEGAEKIIITEIPYLVQKSSLLEEMAKLVLEKKVKGIRDIRDESDKQGLRIVVELQRGVNAERILNFLFKNTSLQKIFYLNLLVLVDGIQPKVLNIFEILNLFLDHRRKVFKRKIEYLLEKANQRAHILQGFLKCLSNLDLTIKIIKNSKDRKEAKQNLISTFKLTEAQVEAVLEMRLSSLVRLEREKIKNELEGLEKEIKNYQDLLKNPQKIDAEIKKELLQIKEEFGDERRTKVNLEKIIQKEEETFSEPALLIFNSNFALKRINPNLVKVQKKGGKGINFLAKDENLEKIFFTNTQSDIFFFCSGKIFKIQVSKIEEGKRESKSISISNYVQIPQGQKISAVFDLKKEEKPKWLLIFTKNGMVKKISFSELEKIRKSGILILSLKDDKVAGAPKIEKSKEEILVFTKNGMALRFKEDEVRESKRKSSGIKGMRLKKDDEVLGVEKIESKNLVLVTENGFGKIIDAEKIRCQKRGGVGKRIIKITQKNGNLCFAKFLTSQQNLILATKDGQLLAIPIKYLPKLSLLSQGVKLIKLDQGDKVVCCDLF